MEKDMLRRLLCLFRYHTWNVCTVKVTDPWEHNYTTTNVRWCQHCDRTERYVDVFKFQYPFWTKMERSELKNTLTKGWGGD